MDIGWSVNKVHVLLVGGQNLDALSLTDADLVLFERRVVLSDQHGGGDAVTAAFAVLRGRAKDGEKRGQRRRQEEKKEKKNREEEKMEMTEEERMRTIEDKVMVCLCGLDNCPAGCDAITADPDLRRNSGRARTQEEEEEK